MHVHITNKQKDLPIGHLKEKIKLLAHHVVLLEKQHFDEVSITFASDRLTRKIHNDYFNDPSPTDCMSFPIDSFSGEKEILMLSTLERCQDPADLSEISSKNLGEIFVCPKTAINYASLHKKDPYEELTLYIVHGLLHLLGYDDLQTQERRTMRRREAYHMKALSQKGLTLSPKDHTRMRN